MPLRLPRAVSTVGRASVAMLVAAGGLTLAGQRLGSALGDVAHVATVTRAEHIELGNLANRSLVFDKDLRPIAAYHSEQDREVVSLAKIPKNLQTSVISIEDRYFYRHKGVNVRATLRALAANTEAGDIEQGGSTITQQLVKNAILGDQRTMSRKVREASYAIQLEKQMTKNQILERYLNTVYLGNKAYGIQAAAQTYFNRNVDDPTLGWAEFALLTALIRNPNGYEPIRHPERAKERRAVVADRLVELKVITPAEGEAVKAAPLPTEVYPLAKALVQNRTVGSNYFVEEVRRVAIATLDFAGYNGEKMMNEGGLRLFTTLDNQAQEWAEEAVQDELPDTGGRFEAALVAVEPQTGAVRALVGGPPGGQSQYNLATQALRQPGSSFKAFVLAEAFEQGYVPEDTISGVAKCAFENPPGQDPPVYVTGNYDNSRGSVESIRAQTLKSNNCAFLRLSAVVGRENVVALTTALGIHPLNPEIRSMALGTQEITPLEMAAAYTPFANDGRKVGMHFIERIEDSSGKVLWQFQPLPQQVMSVDTARRVTAVLHDNVTSGTGKDAQLRGQEVAGKTGTTNDYADAWFVGYSPYLATAVWMGSPTGTKDKMTSVGGIKVTGGTYPARIWHAFMARYHGPDSRPSIDFPRPGPARGGKYIPYSNDVDGGCGVSDSGRSQSCGDSGGSTSKPRRRG